MHCARLSICPSVRLSVCPSVHLSISRLLLTRERSKSCTNLKIDDNVARVTLRIILGPV